MCLVVDLHLTKLAKKRGKFIAYKRYRDELGYLASPYQFDMVKKAGVVIAREKRQTRLWIAMKNGIKRWRSKQDAKPVKNYMPQAGEAIYGGIHVHRHLKEAERYCGVCDLAQGLLDVVIPVTCYGKDVIGASDGEIVLTRVVIEKSTWKKLVAGWKKTRAQMKVIDLDKQ